MSVAVRRALYGKMSGDTTLNGLLATPPSGWTKSIYHEAAPDEAGYPFVIFSKSSGVPTYTIKGRTSTSDKAGKFDTEVWLVKAVDRNSTADPAEGIQTRLDELLTDGVLTISGGTQMMLRRDSDVEFLETLDGIRYFHRGGLFRLIHQ